MSSHASTSSEKLSTWSFCLVEKFVSLSFIYQRFRRFYYLLVARPSWKILFSFFSECYYIFIYLAYIFRCSLIPICIQNIVFISLGQTVLSACLFFPRLCACRLAWWRCELSTCFTFVGPPLSLLMRRCRRRIVAAEPPFEIQSGNRLLACLFLFFSIRPFLS